MKNKPKNKDGLTPNLIICDDLSVCDDLTKNEDFMQDVKRYFEKIIESRKNKNKNVFSFSMRFKEKEL